MRKFALALCSLLLATALWLPAIHLFYKPLFDKTLDNRKLNPQTAGLLERQLALWRHDTNNTDDVATMRETNSEWDLMGRTFLALSLAELSLGDQNAAANHLPIIDRIIEDTLRAEKENGMHHFLMPYSRSRPYVRNPARSLFLDSEIAVMLGARRCIADSETARLEFTQRIEEILACFQQSTNLALESYPDECWLFDHTMALTAIKMSDILDHTNHSDLFNAWLRAAKEKLIHAPTGLLISSYTTDYKSLDGPEGSTIWFAVHSLRLFDEPFARDLYAKTRNELGQTFLGFGWSREWPNSWKSPEHVDSGLVVPVVQASPAASGLALVAAASFNDETFFNSLRCSLNFAAFPVRKNGVEYFAASNAVGDSVILYSLVLGPLWNKLSGRL